jgi:hypothetical protein
LSHIKDNPAARRIIWSAKEPTMAEPTLLVFITLCVVAMMMIAAALIYYHLNRDKLDG